MYTSTKIYLWKLCFLFGFISAFGYDDLSAGKKASQGLPYGSGWFRQIYSAGNAVDRDYVSCTRTRDIGSASRYRETWWNVDLGDVYSVFSIRIVFKDYGEKSVLRQRGRFAGFSLYLSNTSNKDDGYMCYKDGPDLPPLNFTTTCSGYARYVIYYNERRYNYTYPEGYQSSSYTELCEVIVYGCKLAGVYGERCDKKCSEGCHESKCNIVTGACLGCKPGWIGNYCRTPCDSGYYGAYCTHKCSSNCMSKCSRIDGTCICSHGRRGSPSCMKECPSGFYGPNCGHICSQHCKLNDTCDSIYGTCSYGCTDSYTGLKCDVPNQTYEKSKENESSSLTLLVAIVISGCFNVIFLIAITICKRQKIARICNRKSGGPQTCNYTRTEIQTNQADDIHDYQEIGESEIKHDHYSNLSFKAL